MSDSESPPLRLFLDRSTQGKRFVKAVRLLVADVETINDRYGTQPAETVPDMRWIAEASADGRILIGADRNILRNPLERHAICSAAARYVEHYSDLPAKSIEFQRGDDADDVGKFGDSSAVAGGEYFPVLDVGDASFDCGTQ